MNFVEKLLEKAGFVRNEKAAAPSVTSGVSSNPFIVWAQQKKINPQKALEVFTGWVYAAGRAIGMEMGSIEFELYQKGKDRDKQIFEHDILDILSAVNNYQTSFEFWYLVAVYLEIVGNAPIYLEGVDVEGGKPTAIHLFVPSRVRVIADREEFPPRIQGYRYQLGSRVYSFEPYQVLQLKYPDPNDPFEGIGTVQSIAQWVDGDNYAMEFNRRFFLNGARIGGFLESDAAYTPDQLEYLKSSFESAFKGVENAYKVLALPKGTKYEEGGKTQKDLDFSNMMVMMRDRIIAGFKVPRTVLGITDDVNRANANATDYVFAARTIKPIMKFITGYLNEFLVPRYGSDLYLKFVDPVPDDAVTAVEEKKTSLGNAPWKTVNEVREEEGLDPVQGGDELQKPFNFESIGSAVTGTPTATPKNTGSRNTIKTRFARNAEKRQSITKGIAEKASMEIKKLLEDIAAIKAKGRKDLTQLSDDEYETIYKGFALRVDRYEKKEAKAMREVNALQRKEVIENLAKVTKAFKDSMLDMHEKAIKKDDLLNKKGSIQAVVDLSRPIMYELAKNEGKEAGALLGLDDLDIMSEEVRNALDAGLELLGESYTETTRDLLKEKLEQGLKEGMSQDQLAEVVNGIFEYSDEVRAAAVARTETFRIANYSTQEAWRKSGIVRSQKWYTAADERVCPYCSPMNGKVVSIESDFFQKGETITGSDGSTITADYSDIGSPPLHTNCRCYLRPEDISLE